MSDDAITVEIRPRRQFRGFLESTKRWSVLVAHRRAGKTVAVVQKLCMASLTHRRPGPPLRYAYIAPTREQAKDIAWAYLEDYASKIPGADSNRSELKVTMPNRATIRLYSGENYERMRGLYFDGVVSDEDADIPPQAFDYVILPCLLDYDGWHVRIGTPKGKNSFQRAFVAAMKDPDSFALMLKASESGILSESALAVMRGKLSPDAYAQEMECDFSIGRPGAIYAKELDAADAGGRIREFSPEKGALVHTAWDLGSPENTSVVYFQRVGPWLYIVDHDKGLRLTTPERVAHMTAKGYAFGVHCLPHDGAAKRPGGLSYAEELHAAGLLNVRVIPRTDDPERRINRMWEMFPNTYFNEPKTKLLREALEAYHRKEETTSATIKSEIVHDWASHDSDAFGYIGEAEMAGLVTENLPRLGSTTRHHRRVVVTKGENREAGDWEDEKPQPINFRKIRVTR